MLRMIEVLIYMPGAMLSILSHFILTITFGIMSSPRDNNRLSLR